MSNYAYVTLLMGDTLDFLANIVLMQSLINSGAKYDRVLLYTFVPKYKLDILAKYYTKMIEVDKTMKTARHLIDENFQGEGILTVGLALREILNDSCGVISIGPFGCMPTRVAEAILHKEMDIIGKQRIPRWQQKVSEFKDIDALPYLSLETDGNPYPQMVEASLEAFILQAKRIHQKIIALTASLSTSYF